MTDRRIIDFHWHLVESLKIIQEIMKKFQIERIIGIPLDLGNLSWSQVMKMVGMKPKSLEFQNAILKRLPEINQKAYNSIKHENTMIFAEWVSPIAPRNLNSQAMIAKIIPPFDHISENYYSQLLQLISNLNHPIIMIHTGWGSQVEPLNGIIEKFPKKRFVLAHLKEDDDNANFDRIAVMKRFSNVYLEMSYLSSPKRLGQYVKMGFVDRILFGSDFRTQEDEPTLKWMINAVELADISNQDREKIWYTNADSLLKEWSIVK